MSPSQLNPVATPFIPRTPNQPVTTSWGASTPPPPLPVNTQEQMRREMEALRRREQRINSQHQRYPNQQRWDGEYQTPVPVPYAQHPQQHPQPVYHNPEMIRRVPAPVIAMQAYNNGSPIAHQQPGYQTEVLAQQSPYQQPRFAFASLVQQLPVFSHEPLIGMMPGYEGYSIANRGVVRPDRVFCAVEWEGEGVSGGAGGRGEGGEGGEGGEWDDGWGGRQRGGREEMVGRMRDLMEWRSGGEGWADHADAGGFDFAQSQQGLASSPQISPAFTNNAIRGRYLDDNEYPRELQYSMYDRATATTMARPNLPNIRQVSPSSVNTAIRQPYRDNNEYPRALQDSTYERATACTMARPNLPHTGEEATQRASTSNTTLNTTPPRAPPTLSDLRIPGAPLTTSPIRTYTFPFAPLTSTGQPTHLPGPRLNPLSNINERVSRGERVKGDEINEGTLVMQSVIGEMDGIARAAAAGGRGEITWVDGARFGRERKARGRESWEMGGGWKVAGEPPRQKRQGVAKGKMSEDNKKGGEEGE